MAGEWREVTIGDLVWLHDQQITPASAPAELFYHYSIPAYDSGQRPALETGSAIGSNKFVVPRGAVLVSKLNPRLPRVWAPDIPDNARAVASTEFLVLRPRDGVDRRFLKYLMLSPAVRSAMEARVTGTSGSHQRIRPCDLLSISVDIPVDLQEQRAIAHILGTLDDKIELNRRMSETLEAMARALFKAWFVDFDPVRAKRRGDPGGRPRWQRGNPLPPLPEGEGRGEGSLPTKSHARLPSDLLAFARELRQNETDAERLLWRLLRNRSLAGAKFRRQHPFPPYVLDFYCHELKLAIELDGGQHNLPEGRLHDKVRTAKLAEHGIRVLRFWNHEVLRDTESVLEAIYQAIVERREELRPSPPAPLPAGEGSMVSGLPDHLYDLFPDRLVDSELGEIPEGWEVGRLGQVLGELVSGARPKGGAAQEGVPSIGAENVIGLGRYDFSKEKYVPRDFFNELQRKGAAVRPGDVLLYKDGAQIGRKTYFDCGFPHEQCAVNEHVFIVRAKHAHYQRYLFFWLDQDWMTQQIISLNSNSAQPGINRQGVRALPLLKPPDAVVEAFDRLSKKLTDRLFAACHESRTLAALRDALLPKLISGELRVKDAERFLKEQGL